MQESTKNKLTIFSRLWAVSMILFIVFCIVGVIATMNESKDLIGIATLGACAMFLVQVAHVVTSVIVKRGWCIAGSVFGIAVSVFVSLCSVVALAAGQYRPPVNANGPVEETELVAGDSVTFSFAGSDVTSDIVAMVPEKNVRHAVLEWLDESLGGTFDGDKEDMGAIVGHYGNLYVDKLNSISSQGVPDYAELSYYARMDKIYETDKVVTYGLTIDIDMGGAHPLSKEMGATFSKADGKRLTWDMVSKDRTTGVKNVVKEMLKDYFNAKTDDELMKCVQGVKNASSIPLPKTPPYMTEEGFVLIYQQYEIASYAAGMPGDTIPYKTMKPYLTEDVRKLTEK